MQAVSLVWMELAMFGVAAVIYAAQLGGSQSFVGSICSQEEAP